MFYQTSHVLLLSLGLRFLTYEYLHKIRISWCVTHLIMYPYGGTVSFEGSTAFRPAKHSSCIFWSKPKYNLQSYVLLICAEDHGAQRGVRSFISHFPKTFFVLPSVSVILAPCSLMQTLLLTWRHRPLAPAWALLEPTPSTFYRIGA